MRARGKERRERIWFRDADGAEAVDAILFVGLLPGWYPPNYDCGACGYATCAEFLHHTKTLCSQSADLEFTGPVCNLRDVDPGMRPAPPPKPPPSTPSTAGARPASRSPPANSASSKPNTPSPYPCR
jgi:Putative Fe-S cluster